MPERPYVDYRDWLANRVVRTYEDAKLVERMLIGGIISAGEADNAAEARQILNELFDEYIAEPEKSGPRNLSQSTSLFLIREGLANPLEEQEVSSSEPD